MPRKAVLHSPVSVEFGQNLDYHSPPSSKEEVHPLFPLGWGQGRLAPPLSGQKALSLPLVSVRSHGSTNETLIGPCHQGITGALMGNWNSTAPPTPSSTENLIPWRLMGPSGEPGCPHPPGEHEAGPLTPQAVSENPAKTEPINKTLSYNT